MGNNRLKGKKMTMASLADSLSRFVDRPVVDMMELKGNYDFALQFSPEDFRAMMIHSAIAAGVVLSPEAMRAIEGASGDSLFTALQLCAEAGAAQGAAGCAGRGPCRASPDRQLNRAQVSRRLPRDRHPIRLEIENLE